MFKDDLENKKLGLLKSAKERTEKLHKNIINILLSKSGSCDMTAEISVDLTRLGNDDSKFYTYYSFEEKNLAEGEIYLPLLIKLLETDEKDFEFLSHQEYNENHDNFALDDKKFKLLVIKIDMSKVLKDVSIETLSNEEPEKEESKKSIFNRIFRKNKTH